MRDTQRSIVAGTVVTIEGRQCEQTSLVCATNLDKEHRVALTANRARCRISVLSRGFGSYGSDLSPYEVCERSLCLRKSDIPSIPPQRH